LEVKRVEEPMDNKQLDGGINDAEKRLKESEKRLEKAEHKSEVLENKIEEQSR
jgi:hypothetical protein